MDEPCITFDRYDIELFLNLSIRNRRLKHKTSMAYHIPDSTNITKVPLKKLVPHNSTKKALTSYLSEKILQHGREAEKCVVVAWGCKCRATHKYMSLRISSAYLFPLHGRLRHNLVWLPSICLSEFGTSLIIFSY